MSSSGQKPAAKHTWADYELIKPLSSGAFGRVLHMTQIDNNKQVVIKRVQYLSDEEKKLADEEVKMLKLAQSKHIVKYIESFTYDLDLCIVMEFCSGGNLRVLIEAMKKMSIKDRKMKCYMPFYQMLSSLAHLHSLGIVHRDLKPENVFLDEIGNTKTADFGLSQKMASKSYLRSAGTAVYAPSEAHEQNKMTFASDIWVLAVIVIEMLTGVHPYAGKTVNDTIENIKKGKMVPLPDYIQGDLKDMLMNMLNVNADKRPTAKELLDSDLMLFQAQIKKADEKDEKILQLEETIRTQDEYIRRLNEQQKSNIVFSVPTQTISEDIPFSITVQSGSYSKKEKESTYTSTSSEWKTFPISPAFSNGLYRLEMKFNKVGDNSTGVMKPGLFVPFGKFPGIQPFTKDSLVFYCGGFIRWNEQKIQGNQTIKDGDIVAIELNLLAKPRTAHLFINYQQQPVFVSGLPETVQFYFFLNYTGDSITVLSLQKLISASVIKTPDEMGMKWE
ncbi:MAG: putative protein serine/threonine kinase [Streblomastix strix]|uniref:non-specific serine/threonine protein kinase n=1 Tax=Streblomastix strix TaxID=222440 RepID=A0A5J4V3D8_9EUKA|nr:MAG: putative protein serine/threonine kinase [Streblomastix strix]